MKKPQFPQVLARWPPSCFFSRVHVGYLLEIDFHLRPEKRREFQLSSTSLMRPPGKEDLKTVVYEDQNQPNHILWVEEWADRSSVSEYLLSDRFLALQGGLKTLGSISSCRLIEIAGGESIGSQTVQVPVNTIGWTILNRQLAEGNNE